MVEYHLREFKALRPKPEDMEWATGGLEKASVRMKKLDELNRLLAHQPWRITNETIEVRYVCVGHR